MVARRGWPKLMLSDNGSNYVGATREIKELMDSMDQDKTQRLTSNQGLNGTSTHRKHHTLVVYLKE